MFFILYKSNLQSKDKVTRRAVRTYLFKMSCLKILTLRSFKKKTMGGRSPIILNITITRKKGCQMIGNILNIHQSCISPAQQSLENVLIFLKRKCQNDSTIFNLNENPNFCGFLPSIQYGTTLTLLNGFYFYFNSTDRKQTF